MMPLIIDLCLIAFMAITAVAILLSHHLFTVVMLSGVFSLLSAGLLVNLDAVDVAFTEAAVGAGISTVLMLGTLALTTRREKPTLRLSWIGLFTVVATGAALIYGTLDMPAFGDPNAPALKHVVPEYISGSRDDIQVPNIVTAVLASYRAYDTLGEVAVIFTAGIGVLLLLARRREEDEPEAPAPAPKPKDGEDQA
jgi:multicomponent Na+:H+ antiporter subunit B